MDEFSAFPQPLQKHVLNRQSLAILITSTPVHAVNNFLPDTG